MVKFKVLQPFRNKETKEEYEQDQVIELTVKRADEATANLKSWDGVFLERIDNKQEEPETKQEESEDTERKEGE